MLQQKKKTAKVKIIANDTVSNFIIVKNVGNITDVVSSYKLASDEYISNFHRKNPNDISRIHPVFEIIPDLATYFVSSQGIEFDCVNKIPKEVFPNNTPQGLIHYNAEKRFEQGKSEILVESRCVFEKVENPESGVLKFNQKANFVADTLKLFPAVLDTGFILCVVYKNICELYMTIADPQNRLVGRCKRYETANIVQYIYPLWKFFEVKVSNTAEIYILDTFDCTPITSKNEPLFVRLVYELSDPSTINYDIIGKQLVFKQ